MYAPPPLQHLADVFVFPDYKIKPVILSQYYDLDLFKIGDFYNLFIIVKL